VSLAEQIGDMVTERKNHQGAREFAKIAHFVLSRGGFSKASLAVEHHGTSVGMLGPKLGPLVKAGGRGGITPQYLKAAVAAQTLSGSNLTDYRLAMDGFAASLVNAGAFDGMLASMVPLPFASQTVGAVSVAAAAYSVSEGSAKPLTKISLTSQQVDPRKAHALVTFTEELVRATSGAVTDFIARELRQAVLKTADEQFIAALTSGLSVGTSTGSTSEAVRADLSALLAAISTGQGSTLFVLTTPLIVKRWSMLTDQHGLSAFPNLTPVGGTIQGMTVIPTDGMPVGQVVVADASGIGGNGGEIGLEENRDSTVNAADVPDSPVTSATPLISLWQLNLIGIRIERFFVCAKLRSDAVAVLSNGNSYGSGNSPP
jgi:hypothetical protein